MKLIPVCLSVICMSSVSAQSITGSGTPNTIPQFTSATVVGDSPIIQSNGRVAIGSVNPQALFEVFDATGDRPAPYAVLGHSICPHDNFCGGIRGDADNYGIGVIGIGNGETTGGGVYGATFSKTGFAFGARGDAVGTTGNAVGVFGRAASRDGTGGQFVNLARGNIIVGSSGPEGASKNVFRVDGQGRVFADGGFRPFGADFAESMQVTGDRGYYEPGDLLAIDRSGARRLARSHSAYSTLVAGIYSTRPGVLGSLYSADETESSGEVPVAITGIVPCKVSAENGPIEPGDLLVSSTTPGHAMKGTDRSKMLGAVVAKALEPLRGGKGLIQVLITLQ
ncbi:MAG TPA: hypothetical protein VFA04_21785 [Bryobacteraceae bacterium]|nr:hypothetical protein [Bryobacteraceae bacterium]